MYRFLGIDASRRRNTDTRARVHWSELEVPPGQQVSGRVHWAELFIDPTGGRNARVHWAELELPGTGTPGSQPASYTNGPLGANNVLPADFTGTVCGVWHSTGGNTVTQQRTELLQRMADANRAFDLLGTQQTTYGTDLSTCLDWLHGSKLAPNGTTYPGSVPVLTWSPSGSIATINSGGSDAEIDSVATTCASKQYRILIRLFHEFNLSGLSYSLSSTTAASWISAWQRVVDRFKLKTQVAGKGLAGTGVNNVGFWWTPVELAGANATTTWTAYPGDTYVDLVGSDRYNRNDTNFQTPVHSGWAEFGELFDYNHNYGSGSYTQTLSYANRWGPQKPFMVAETGSKYDTAQPRRKADWYRNVDLVAKPAMQYLHGIMFFDQWVTNETNDWRFDRNQPAGSTTQGTVDSTTYQGWLDLSARPRMNVGVVGGAT